MTPDTDAAAGGSERVTVAVHKAGGEGPLTPRAAANSVMDWRRKNQRASARTNGTEQRHDPEQRQAPRSEAGTGAPVAPATKSTFASTIPDTSTTAPAATDWSAEALAKTDADPQDIEAPGETERADPEGDPRSEAGTEPPTIEPPRSWTKEEKERFQSLPRETQEYLSVREQERDREFRRSQNEAAEVRKAMHADRTRLEQARLYYESVLPTLLGSLQAAHGHDFSDLKSAADVRQLSLSNPARYAQWDAQQRQLAAVQKELALVQQLQARENAQRFTDFAGRERERFVEKAPEMADDAERMRMRDAAATVLTELGFSDEELGSYWNGESALSFHDHRFLLLLRDAIQLRDAQDKARGVHGRSVPPVQKPGVAQPRGAARDAQIQNLTKQLDNARGMEALRLAAKLTAERRRAAS